MNPRNPHETPKTKIQETQEIHEIQVSGTSLTPSPQNSKNEPDFPKKMFLPLSIQSGSKTFQVKALLDSGSDECLIDENIVNAYQLPLNLLKTPIALFLADGQPASKSHVTHESQLLKVTCQDHIEITKFYVSSIKYPRYLGSRLAATP
ncbi:hypothetical protein BASA84_000231 [Batrachochytrium salamandrivorans]|nr:hypothetical protein BASA84_000231 [Batrachochytrium salamandrivorans]